MRGFACSLWGFFFLAALPCLGENASRPNDSLPPAPAACGGSLVDTLAGDLPGIVVAKKKPYLVASDVYVPAGKTVMIEAGTVILFKNFTSLHVSGILLARGDRDKPIVFTSENDREYNPQSSVDPAPFDWNGIYIHEDGVGTHLAYCAVLYSVEGITSLTKFIRLNTCLFLHNGRANLTVEGKQHTVSEQPYDYIITAKDQSLMRIPANILKDPLAVSRFVIRYSGFTAAATGCVLGLVYGSRFNLSSHELNNLSATSRDNLAHNSGAAWKAAKIDKNRNGAALIASIAIVAVGGIGIGWSFTF